MSVTPEIELSQSKNPKNGLSHFSFWEMAEHKKM